MRILRVLPLVAVQGLVAVPAVAQEPARIPAPDHPATVTNAIGMEFVLIQPGTMTVGRFQPVCPTQNVGNAEPGGRGGQPRTRGQQAGAARAGGRGSRPAWTAEDYALCEEMVRRDATPGFQVTISEPFYIGKYEVTQEQWRRVMGTNPSVFQGSRIEDDADRHPVDNVTFEDAQAFVGRLNELDPGARYRLPTEFEWEYAARAGAEGDLPWADARAQAQTSRVSTLPVGQKEPNAWGLHDTVGNVWEWVEDWYNEKTFPDPTPPQTGTVRVLKGGSFLSDVKNLTYRTHAAGPADGWDVGFRVVREPR